MCPNPRSDPAVQRVVVIGTGHAGVQVADALRSGGHVGPLALVGDEPVLPYQRPPLSKEYLSPAVAPTTLSLRARQYFADHRIDLHIGVTATNLERRSRTVRLCDGRELPYDVLVLATGTVNRTLAVPGAELAGIHTLRTVTDAEALRSALPGSRAVLIVGAGFIGLEVAATARKHGLEVTVLEAADRPLGRALSAEMAGHIAVAHRRPALICGSAKRSLSSPARTVA